MWITLQSEKYRALEEINILQESILSYHILII